MGLKNSASVLIDSSTFRVFFISRIISVLGSVFARVALPLEVYNRSGSESLAAALTAVSLAPVLLVGIPAGVFADRRARVPMMRFCEAVSAVVVGVLALVLFLMGYVALPVFSAVAVVSVASVLFDSASFALVPRMVGKDRLGQANSLIYGSNTVVSLIGPALGGILYSAYGVVAVLAANCLAFILSFICLLIVPSDHAPVRVDNVNAASSFLSDMREGIIVIFRSKLLAYLVLTGAAAAIAGGALTASLVILVAERLNMGGEVLGLLVSTIGGGAFLGSVLIASLSETVGQLKIALLGFPLAALSFIGVTLSSTVIMLFVACLIWGIAYTALIINNVTLRQMVLPDSLQGRVNATARSLAWGGEPLGAAAAAGLVLFIPIGAALFVCAIPFIVLSSLSWATPLRNKNLEGLHIEPT